MWLSALVAVVPGCACDVDDDGPSDCASWLASVEEGEVPRDARPISMFIIARQSCILCSPACEVALS